MILESAFMTIHQGQATEFLAALEQAKLVIAEAQGFRGIEVRRGVERPDTFLLCISWDTLEDHTEGFRGSPLFAAWRGHIGGFFAEPPLVEHWTTA
ncbi:MAG: antibiotic biosynthesis monooxygenase family protein [Candidatus Nanopelagicales bacterium]